MKDQHVLFLWEILGYGFLVFLLSALLFPVFINFITKFKLTQKIREDGLSGGAAKLFKKLHQHKAGTPTMGGAVIILAIVLVALFSDFNFLNLENHKSLIDRGQTYLPLFTLVFVGGLGLIDDYLNITEKSAQKGLSARVKMMTLVLFSLLAAWWFVFQLGYSSINIPGNGSLELNEWVYFAFVVFLIVGVSNAVNITDGLDGLAGGLLAIAFTVFGVLAYFDGLEILAIFCLMVVAAIMAFLWFNVAPARIYMGDTGSLSLGATLAVMALMTDEAILLMIIGCIFMLETISVVLQLFWKKFFGRKLFLIAPIHHHFEAKGWSETQIVMRFWILGALSGGVGLLFGLLG